VSVIDTTTNTVIATIPVGIRPSDIAYDSANEQMYVANRGTGSPGTGTVSVIDTTTNTVIDTITVGDVPRGIAYDPVNERMYVTNGFDSNVSVIDTTTNTVIDTVIVVGSPSDIAYDSANERMYVSSGGGFVSVIFLNANNVCQDSGFDAGEIRTYQSNGQTIEQITCVNFVGECSGEIEDGETRECTVQNYAVRVLNVTGENGIMENSNTQQGQQGTNDIITTTTADNNNDPTIIENIVEPKEEEQKIIIEEQGIQDSPRLTASEKITKLKQQWLDLLP
jgi:YVTN family beta-propeller protein